MKQIYLFLWAAIGVVLLSTGCSSTSAIPDGEQLYTGMKPTEYVDADKSEHATSVREELDVVLATKPNGSLFGSPTPTVAAEDRSMDMERFFSGDHVL